MNLRTLVFAAVVTCAAASQPAAAQALQGPPPPNAYIFFNNLDWAWASPCNPGGCSNIVLNYNFRYATAAEWATHPEYTDFIDPLGNANGAQNGVRIRCASAYFDVSYSHCDDVNFRFVANGGDYQVASGPNGSQIGYSETLLVRDTVPEPASVALMGTGLLGLLAITRRRRQA